MQPSIIPVSSPRIAAIPPEATPIQVQSPRTPLGAMLNKVSSSPDPWSKTLLQQAANLKMVGKPISEDELRRSKRCKS